MNHVVEIFFDIDRPGYFTTPEWVDFRFKFFYKYTLQALRAQDIGDYHILVHCGQRNRAITENLAWPMDVACVYDFGRFFYSLLEGPSVIITRIDSDDLFRFDALKTIRQAIGENQRRPSFAFKHNLCWDMINGIIFEHRRASSPFVSRVWPLKMIKTRWPEFYKAHFRAHGGDGLGDRSALALPANRVLVTKHGQNTNLLKRGKTHPVFTEAERKALTAYHDDGKIWPVGKKITDPLAIGLILAHFGVKE
jgi:hypothetical protein